MQPQRVPFWRIGRKLRRRAHRARQLEHAGQQSESVVVSSLQFIGCEPGCLASRLTRNENDPTLIPDAYTAGEMDCGDRRATRRTRYFDPTVARLQSASTAIARGSHLRAQFTRWRVLGRGQPYTAPGVVARGILARQVGLNPRPRSRGRSSRRAVLSSR